MRYTNKILSLFLLLSLVIVPISHANPFKQLSIEDEFELGEKYNLAMKTQAPLIFEPIVVSYLQQILDNILIYVEKNGYQYEANLILDPSLNAFAAPGGYLYVNSGLLLKLENESELASILAHEIAHVSQRHIAKRYGKSNAISVATLLASLASVLANSGDVTGAVFAGSLAAGQAAILNYSRVDENEADSVGFEYTVKAGYDPYGYVTSFTKLQDQVGYDSSYPVYLSTHPDLDDRISKVASRIRMQADSYSPLRTDNSEFLFVQKFIRANYQDVKQAKTILLKEDQSLPDTKLALAIIAVREKNMKQAEKLYKELYAQVNSKAFANTYTRQRKAFFLREIGDYHYKYGDLSLATELFQFSLALNNDDLMTNFYLGRSYQKNEDYSNSIIHFASILDTYPHDSQVHQLLGQVYAKDEKLMLGYLHMSYYWLYRGNFTQAESMIKKSKELAQSSIEKDKIKQFNKDFKEYKALFKI